MWWWYRPFARVKTTVGVSLILVLCVFLVDFLGLPVLPSLRRQNDNVAASRFSQLQSFYEAVLRFPPRSIVHGSERGGHRYRNATWSPVIAELLSGSSNSAPIVIVSERFPNRPCTRGCSGRGVCNHYLGECRCFHGFGGEGCELEVEYPCTVAENLWRVSTCGAFCDKSLAFCYCGEGTRYPRRPVAESCGFIVEDGVIRWNLKDPGIFAEEGKGDDYGWCNVVPTNVNIQRKSRCQCTYDGTGGPFCDLQVRAMCINQCSGNGECRGGFCACAEGWYGIDCSIPSLLQSVDFDSPPNWLLNATTTMERSAPLAPVSAWEETFTLNVPRRRPLIYVYDLPARFNSLLMEGRHYRLWCAIRQYDEMNKTMWTNNLYGSEPALLESILSSTHRTTNAEEADYFYVPAFEGCAHVQADSAPHTDMQREYIGLRAYFAAALLKEAYEHIKEKYPYWNRFGGRDHIWLFPWDEGSCPAPKEIWSSIMLVHWGNTNSIHNYSTTAYNADSWSEIPPEWRGDHPCYDPLKDVVLPAWKKPAGHLVKRKLAARAKKSRKTLFYFNGNLGSMYDGGRPEPHYSMGLRQRLAKEFGSFPNRDGQLGRQAAPDVTVVDQKTTEYELELARSRFCGVLPGDGWSGRIEDSILHGCIPVIIQDGIHLPFENVLDYKSFAIRIAESDLPDMVQILRAINDSQVDSMLSEVQEIWQRFTYHNTVHLEAKREKLGRRRDALWAYAYSRLDGDDAFATLMQILLFKLSQRGEGRS